MGAIIFVSCEWPIFRQHESYLKGSEIFLYPGTSLPFFPAMTKCLGFKCHTNQPWAVLYLCLNKYTPFRWNAMAHTNVNIRHVFCCKKCTVPVVGRQAKLPF